MSNIDDLRRRFTPKPSPAEASAPPPITPKQLQMAIADYKWLSEHDAQERARLTEGEVRAAKARYMRDTADDIAKRDDVMDSMRYGCRSIVLPTEESAACWPSHHEMADAARYATRNHVWQDNWFKENGPTDGLAEIAHELSSHGPSSLPRR